jgi:hypothetical protein
MEMSPSTTGGRREAPCSRMREARNLREVREDVKRYSIDEKLATHYFGLAFSKGYLNRQSFMISPNCEGFFKKTQQLLLKFS